MNRLFVLREAAHLASLLSFLATNWKVFAAEGKFLAVTVSLYKDPRTLAQNRRYWGPAVMGQIVEQAWAGGRQYSKEAWHEDFKRRFIGVIDLPDGGVLGMSSSDLNIEEFGVFMQQVEVYAAQELAVRFD